MENKTGRMNVEIPIPFFSSLLGILFWTSLSQSCFSGICANIIVKLQIKLKVKQTFEVYTLEKGFHNSLGLVKRKLYK